MTAAATDHFKEATNGTRPSPTTLTAIHTNGQTTFTVNSLTGWPTTTGVGFIVYNIDSTGAKIAGSQTDWAGVGNGTTSITGAVLKAGTDNGYSVGAVVECAPTAAWANDIVDGILIQHNQDGTHGSITTTGTINTSTVSSLQDTGIALSTYRTEVQTPFTASGGVWTGDAYASTKNASMTAWTGYINGQRGTIGAVTARLFTASKDTYVDVLNTAGVFTLVYTEVTNNAASPALAANSIRLAIVVTGATNIAAAGSINQGQQDRVLPIASSIAYSVTDSLGNLIYNTSPNPTLLGFRQIYSNVSTTTTPGFFDVTGLSVPVIVPAGRKVKISARASRFGSTGNVALAFAIREGSTVIDQLISSQNNTNIPTFVDAVTTPTAGLHTYLLSVAQNGAGTMLVSASNSSSATTDGATHIKVELV